MGGTGPTIQRLLHCSRGQAAVEYIVICGILVATLLAAPSVYDQVSTTLANKYRSYVFSVAITDPPSSEFDTVGGELEELGDWVENVAFPGHHDQSNPGTAILREFEGIIHDL